MNNIDKIKVSVVLPVYNAERFILKAVNSLLLQTHQNIEIICIDDASTDSSFEILSKIKDARLVILKNDVNKGVIYTRTKCYSLCTGSFVANMDADDISEPNRILTQLKFFFDNPDIDVVGTFITMIDEDGVILDNWSPPISHDLICASLLFETAIANPTAMFRNKVIREEGFHDAKCLSVEDYEFFCRLAIKKYKLSNIPESLVKYRIVGNGMTSTFEEKVEIRDAVHKIIYKRNFDTLGMLDLDLKVHRSLVIGDIVSIEQLNIIDKHLKYLLNNIKEDYCSRIALEHKVSMIWAYCCLRASSNIRINPFQHVFFNGIVSFNFYTIKNLFKAVVRSYINFSKIKKD